MPRASGLEARLRKEFADAEITLIAGSNGVYDITVDGREIFSKHKSRRFPDNDEIVRLLAS
ncbi:MAG TPA: SelT/SelW/SelH family protein [Desulfurivibrio alkaliphilus]|uniref:SelT/SelW/SelH family protein n=1 Tax=Desulfurivibrio alkaliphilus TaxID=427923 RepID=A0A7C2XYL4_9BACT|nr:SelT/SelW/SelH family protein [Desulfurivibrio alkaliphilus]